MSRRKNKGVNSVGQLAVFWSEFIEREWRLKLFRMKLSYLDHACDLVLIPIILIIATFQSHPLAKGGAEFVDK